MSQRYFVSPDQIHSDHVCLTGDTAHHIIRVMRSKPGDYVVICDNTGKEYDTCLETFQKDQVRGRIVSERASLAEPRLRITLAQALVKSDKMAWIVQKGTELGVSRIVPFSSDHTVVALSDTKATQRQKRWHKVAKEAAEQSRRGRIPDVDVPVNWSDVLAMISQYDLAVIPYERETKQAFMSMWQAQQGVQTCLLIIGPEGGFSEEEVAQAQQTGAIPVHLGPRILRAETAALATLACMTL